MQIYQHALIVLLAVYSCGAMGNECAILATGAASDLAIDDPERFENLTRVCRGESATKRTTNSPDRSSPASTLRSLGSATEKPARPIGTPKNQAIRDDNNGKKNIGCEFLFYPTSGSTHSVETEACKDGENLTCKRVGANSAQWVKGGTACAIAPDSIHNFELNLKHRKEMLNKMKDLHN